MKIKDIKKIAAIVLSMSLVLGSVAGIGVNKAKAADYGLSNPRVDSAGNVTWDCAYFGSYYQTAKWTKEPIKWRVLSVDENNNALIVADKILDGKPYDEMYISDVTWENSVIRSWLNGYSDEYNIVGIDYSSDNFMDEAFTEEEQAAIKTTTVINNDNPEYGTKGCNDTEDKVYLLSIEELSNVEYGFVVEGRAERVKVTDYATVNGVESIPGRWWLRTRVNSNSGAQALFCDNVEDPYYADVRNIYGVRPVLSINLSSSSVWTDAGVMDSEGNVEVSEDDVINAPVVKNGVTTWDCIYFGNYNQTVKEWNKEPIKWRVLSVDGDDAFLVADKNLDCKQYDELVFPNIREEVTWETSTIRSWLNGYGADFNGKEIDYSTNNFIDEAFTEEEQATIKTVTVINNDNPSYGIDGGNNTEDKVYLLSIEEVGNTEYGFDSRFYVKNSDTWRGRNTDYATLNGVVTADEGNGHWWLRSPGDDSNKFSYVNCYRRVEDAGCISSWNCGVRPALHINLSSSVWEAAGTVKSVMTSYGEQVTASPTPTTEPDITPTEQPITSPSSSPQPPVATQTPVPIITPTQAPIVTQVPAPIVTTDTPKADEKDSNTDEKLKTFKLSSVKIKKNTTKITGKVSVSKVTVKIKVGSKAWKKATVKGKKFTLKTAKLKKNTKVQIKVSKKGYKTLKKSFKVK